MTLDEAASTSPKLLYLPKDTWSPRYDSTFYTVKLEGKQKLSELPEVPSAIGGKSNLPAYYYEVAVYREHDKKTVLRRYSQFNWLYEQLIASPPQDEQPPDAGPIRLPGACPLQWQDDKFAQTRLGRLMDFIGDTLARPGYASHPAVLSFLELDTTMSST